MKAQNVKMMIAATILGGAVMNFSSCEDKEMKSQIAKILENDATSAKNLATLQQMLASAQTELEKAKEQNDLSAEEFLKIQARLDELQTEIQNASSKSELEKLQNELENLQNDLNGDFITKILFTNGHDFVDLGLPSGNLWSPVNLGASSPEEAGGYYSWGELKPKTNFTNDNYTVDEKKKYNKTDQKKELELADDAARVLMGGKWRIPSSTDFQELKNNTYYEWTENYNGKSGVIYYKKKEGENPTYDVSDVHLFLPALGSMWQTKVNDTEQVKYYMRNIYVINDTSYNNAYVLQAKLDSTLTYRHTFNSRHSGFPIRPVLLKVD